MVLGSVVVSLCSGSTEFAARSRRGADHCFGEHDPRSTLYAGVPAEQEPDRTTTLA